MTIFYSLVIVLVSFKLIVDLCKQKTTKKALENGFKCSNKAYKKILIVLTILIPIYIYDTVNAFIPLHDFSYDDFISSFIYIFLIAFWIVLYPYNNFISEEGIRSYSLIRAYDTILSYKKFSHYQITKRNKLKLFYIQKSNLKFSYKLYIKAEDIENVKALLDEAFSQVD